MDFFISVSSFYFCIFLVSEDHVYYLARLQKNSSQGRGCAISGFCYTPGIGEQADRSVLELSYYTPNVIIFLKP